MGTVMRGFDIKLRRHLALKVAPLPRGEMPRDMLARFAEEAQITAQLEHPNVMPVHDLGLDPEGRPYFSMKLISGKPLDLILDNRQKGDAETLSEFGLRRLLDVFLQICQAIEYAHARGVIHRDLKPANVMVGDFGEVLVMDWGVAKLMDREERPLDSVSTAADEVSRDSVMDLPAGRSSAPPPPLPGVTSVRAGSKAWDTQAGSVLGTPAYMSPEQAKGERVDSRSDIYALGVMLYEIICGQVPFEDEDPQETLRRVVYETPRRPSEINRSTPLALEALALRLLEKDPEQRTLTIAQIRAHVQNYIEGIGRDYRRQSFGNSAAWIVGALLLFAFLVWYLTGKSIEKVLVLGPPAVLNAVGWFLFAVALGYPLWAVGTALRQLRKDPNRFRAPTAEERFVSGFLAHRTFAAAIAPLFQLVFIVELVTLAALQARRGTIASNELVQQIARQMRAEWSEALIVTVVFLFAYLFLLSTEVRYARRIDRYELLMTRRPWESVWPFFLIIVLLLTIATTDVLTWALSSESAEFKTMLREQLFTPRLRLFEIMKTLVFQGTFLLGLSMATLVASFPFSELLAALRMAYQPADEASVRSRAQYFARSLATFRIARAVSLYGGAMISSLTAITMLSDTTEHPLLEQVLYILGPWLIGFMGYSAIGRYVRGYLENAPAVQRMVSDRTHEARKEQRRALLEQLKDVSWRSRILQLGVPVLCVIGYLFWSGSGIHKEAIRHLMIPVTSKGWLLILPYAFLVPVLLVRDQVQSMTLERELRARAAGKRSIPPPA
jgi:serine/threonine protein kinase